MSLCFADSGAADQCKRRSIQLNKEEAAQWIPPAKGLWGIRLDMFPAMVPHGALKRMAMARTDEPQAKRPEPDSGPDTIPFGKHKGAAISDVPPAYLIGLCCWQLAATSKCNVPDCSCESLRCFRVGKFKEFARGDEDWRHWLKRNHPGIVTLARRYVRDNHLCHHCGERLVPVGNDRANGAAHRDWVTRTLHKKCWRAVLLNGLEMSGSETDSA